MTKIEWTEKTWNVVTGCAHASPGCDHCYAERMSKRLAGRFGYPRDEPFAVTLHPERLDEPLRWRKPRRCFVCSMSDLFHPDVPEEFIRRIWTTMALARVHTFQVLTKRPQRMAALCRDRDATPAEVDEGCEFGFVPGLQYDGPAPNVWVGTSVENQRYADLRIPHLLATPAAVRFLSVEPLLGPVDLSEWINPGRIGVCKTDNGKRWHDVGACEHCQGPRIDWCIVGGESGPGARPMEQEWAESVVAQCHAAGVAVFVKQLGSVLAKRLGCADRKGGKLDEFPASLQVRQWPGTPSVLPAAPDHRQRADASDRRAVGGGR